jgi:hypothetical protein
VLGGLSSRQGTSKHKRNQQRANSYRHKEAASRQRQLLTTCVKLKDLCHTGQFGTTSHSTVMEQLRFRADRFRKQGRLQEEEVEEIIKEIKENDKLTNAEEGR